MRRSVVVLAIAMLALPSTLPAQQREEASAATSDSRATDRRASASEPAARKSAAPRSLMGMVMATLIDSAQQSERQGAAQPHKTAAPAASAPAPTTGTATANAPAAEQVAVQAVP